MTTEVILQYADALDAGQALPTQQDFVAWAQSLNLADSLHHRVCVRIVSDEESAALNQRYRGKPQATNVLSFPAKDYQGAQPSVHWPDDEEAGYLGDLVMAASVITKEAAEQGKTPTAHWAHLFIHGMLHLLGYQHDNDAQASEMESREVAILQSLGFPDPYVPLDQS